jgi:hypothetical protein
MRQVLGLALALGTFWPGILLYYTGFQEGLQQAFAIILAGCFYLGITRRAELSNPVKIGILLLILVGAALRMSWVALAFPWLMLVLPNNWQGLVDGARPLCVFWVGSCWFLQRNRS